MKRYLVVVPLVVLACSSRSAPPAGQSTATTAVHAADRVLATLGAMPSFDGRLGRGGKLETANAGYTVPRGFHLAGTQTFAYAPRRANEPIHFEDPSGAFTVDITDDSLKDVATEVRDAAVVHANAFEDGDVAHVVTGDSVEEIRVLRAVRPVSLRYAIHLSPGASLRLRDERVEIYDRAGVLRVASAPMFAVDGKGLRRSPKLALANDTLTVSFDTAGMTAPIAIDPLWQLTGSTSLPAMNPAIAVATSPTTALYLTSPPWSYDAYTDTWTARPAFANAHNSEFGAVLVPSLKKVLVFGNTTNAELYSFGSSYGGAATGNLTVARNAAGAALLGDGGPVPERVLVMGGQPGSGALASTEWWDPGTGTWSSRASMNVTRFRMGVAVFKTGGGAQRVLVAGGHDGTDATAKAEVYDPIANTWTNTTNAMAQARIDPVTVTLPNGKVLVAGGAISTYCCSYTETTSIYDPATNSFTAGPSMKYQRSGARGLLLASGKVLVAGGNGHLATGGSNVTLSSTELYDPVTNTWSDGPDLVHTRTNFALVPLSNGRAMAVTGITGGSYDASAEIFSPDPQTCTGTSASCPYCVDGYCCDRACGGQCEACDVGGREGICSTVSGEAPHGSRAACSPFVTCAYSASTGSSACTTSCTADTACASGTFCSGGTCVAKKSNGAACGAANQCSSGNCVDGFCCNTACTGQCNACDVSGAEGTCSTIDGAPHGSRSACPTSGYGCVAGACGSTCTKDAQCVGANYCNGSGACVPRLANGSVCTGATQCASTVCDGGYCCAAACTGACSACGPTGTCAAVTGPVPAGKSCGAYASCNAGACASTCTSDAECTTGFFCNASNRCVVRKTGGASCLADSECTSGACAGGVCCDKACNGECESCNLPGSVGTCKVKSSGAACGLSGCVGGYTVAPSSCDGTSNACPLGAIAPCPNGLKCADKISCKTTCASDADCQFGTCDTSSGKCASAWDGGVDTGTPDASPDTSVPDTSVPDTSVPDTSVADSSPSDAIEIADVPDPPFKGTTTISGDFQRCTKGSECSTGHCVEGVCCDTPCTERCHSCALLTSPGKCTPEPVGVDLKQECGPALSCLGTCGGDGECIGAGSGTMCARNRCTGPSTGAGPAYCAAPGAKCDTDEVVPFDCGPYICEPAFGACRSNCTASSDCAQGFICEVQSKTCVTAAATGDGTGGDGGGGCTLASRSTRGAPAAGTAFALLALAVGVARRRVTSR